MEVDLSRLPARVRNAMDDIFRRDFDLKALKAIERQARSAKAARDRLKWTDTMAPQFTIDPFVDSIWRQFYGHNYTEDPELMKFLARRNEEIVSRARSGRIVSALASFAGCTKRFSKRYEFRDGGTPSLP